jgi:hypothetical protein
MLYYGPSAATIHVRFVHERPRTYVGELSMDPSAQWQCYDTCANDSPRLIVEGMRQLA